MTETMPEALFHIYPTDCDMMGHLNHAEMLGFLERARWTLFDHALDAQALAAHPVLPVVRHVEIDYLAPTLPGEDLAVRSGLLKTGNTSFTVRQEARNTRHGELAARATLVVVAIDRAGKPVPVPEDWKAAMPPWPGG